MNYADITDYRAGYRAGWVGRPLPGRYSEYFADGHRDGAEDQEQGRRFGANAVDEAGLS